MLIRLSRLLFWLAACAAGLALLGPERLGTWLTATAGLGLLGSYGLWRLGLAQQQAQAAADDEIAPVHLGDAGLVEIATRLVQAVNAATGAEAALHAAARLLRSELGARDCVVHRVLAIEAPIVRLQSLIDGGPGGHGVEHRVRLEQSPLGLALRDRCVAGAVPGPFAIPVDGGGGPLAVLELGEIALEVEPAALAALLELVRLQLGEAARRQGGAARQRDELREAEERARDFAAAVGENLFVANPQRSAFEFIAAGVFDTWGMTREQFEARNDCFLDHVVETDRLLLAERVNAELRGEAVDITFRIRHPARGLRWLRSRTHTRRRPDGSLRVCGMVADVTDERRRADELERARDEAQAASEAKSQFMANMSHEIRTPMNGILGMTELLLGTPLDDRQRRFAQAVYRSGETLLEIINDILDFATIEAGRLELAPTDFVLRGVVEDTLELLAPRAHEKGLELSFREASGLPAVVHGDPLRLRQVLTNLVANAIKFTEHGEVVVDLRRGTDPRASAGEPGPSFLLEFEVRDTGIGIDAEVLPRLFTAFSQASGGLSRRHGGTGLGLAISRQLVELMGGRIAVRSAPGIGSEFRFTLPVQAAAPGAMAEPAEGDLAALRVLVVEDNLTNRTVLENLLGAWGMEVVLAEDGAQALDLLLGPDDLANRFDAALVDLQMPRLDGLGLARALQASGRHPGLKLLLLSSLSSPDDVRAAREAGFDRFIAKPVRQAELRQALLGVISSRGDGPVPAARLERNVLVVEDNRVNQEVMVQMLRRLGCRVQVVSGATEGLRALCEQSFDLVLMDIQMPGMDGIEALHWFRRGGDGRFPFLTPPRTPVVAVTANALDGDEQRFLDLGFDDYLSKPFRQSQLFAMLTRHLNPSAPLPPADAPEPGAIPPAMADAPQALDAAALDRLRELDPKGANKLIERVLKAFETSVARLLPQLHDARQLGDLQAVYRVAHTIKSSSASIGALRLSQLCVEVENSIRLEQAGDLDPRVDAMCAELEVVLQALRAWTDGKS